MFESRRGGGSEWPDLASSHGAIYACPGIDTIDKLMSVVMWLSGPGEGWRPPPGAVLLPPHEGSWLNPFFSPSEYLGYLPKVFQLCKQEPSCNTAGSRIVLGQQVLATLQPPLSTGTLDSWLEMFLAGSHPKLVLGNDPCVNR